jgi:hypothetical protein
MDQSRTKCKEAAMSNIKPPPMPEPDVLFVDGKDEWGYDSYGSAHSTEQLAARDAQWLEKVGPLAEAVEAAFACGMIPTTSASEGGAAKHSQQVRVADNLRAALAAITKD